MPRRRHHGCEVPGCTRAHEALGLCDTHYVARHCRGAGAPRPVMKRSLAADIDELVVERLAAGDITPGFTTWERRAASAKLHQAGPASAADRSDPPRAPPAGVPRPGGRPMIPWICKCGGRGEAATKADAFRDWRLHARRKGCSTISRQDLADALSGQQLLTVDEREPVMANA